jgi:hypothetical protein
VAVVVPPDPAPPEEALREPVAVTGLAASPEPHDELAALDAGWD